MNEYNFKIGEQILVEYGCDVTYNATVASDPKNGKMKVNWDSRRQILYHVLNVFH